MIEIIIDKADASVTNLETLTSGMVNMVTLHFTLSEHWEGLTKVAVFSNGQTTIDVLESEWLTADTCRLPPEMVAIPGKKVSVGLRGHTTADGETGILPSTLCSLGTVKAGPAAEADASTHKSLPIWEQLQQQYAKLQNCTKLCYTTLMRPKATVTNPDPKLRIQLQGIENLTGTVRLQVFVCMRRRGLTYYWRHPSNYSAELGENVVKFGYGEIAGQTYAHGEGSFVSTYPEVPEWMPNSGFLETEFAISPVVRKRGYYMLDLSSWLLPLLKPINEELDWKRCGFMGLQSDGTIAPLLFQFRLMEDGKVVGTAENTLAVGMRKQFPIDESVLSTDGCLKPSALYISIR